MTALTLGDLFVLLQSQRWAEIRGAVETDQIDFKLTPYNLSVRRKKWDLARDVAAFANEAGGVIVIGVRTQPDRALAVDRAVEIAPVARITVDAQQILDVVAEWIRPRPERVGVRWFPPDADTPEGLLVLEVPSQPPGLKPFVVRWTFPEDDVQVEAMTLPRREGARNVFETAETLQRQIAEGRRTPMPPIPSAEAQRPNVGRADEDVNAALELQEWEGQPVFVLQAVPDGPAAPIEGYYVDVREALERPEVVRREGFAMRWRVDVNTWNGDLVSRSTDGMTWVSRDGRETDAHVVAPGSHLGWFFNQDREDGPLILHPIALAEVTLEFFRFFDRVIRPRARGPWRFRVVCLMFARNQVAIPDGWPDSRDEALFSMHGSGMASGDNWRREIPDSGDAEQNAYFALAEVYALFGMDPDHHPLIAGGRVLTERLEGMRHG